MAQHKVILPYLIEFYQNTLVPQIPKLFLKLMNFRIDEDDVDHYATYLLEQLCFNDQIIDKLSSFINIGDKTRSNSSRWPSLNKSFGTSNRKPTPFNLSSSHSRVSSGGAMAVPENIVPLEIQKPRAVKSNGVKSSKYSEDQQQSFEIERLKKRCSDNLRAKSSSSSLNGNFVKSQSTGTTSRKSSKTINGTSRNVSNENVERESMQVSGVYNADDFAQPQGSSSFNDNGTNVFVSGYNGDSYNAQPDTAFPTSSQQNLPQSRPEKVSERKGLKGFFS